MARSALATIYLFLTAVVAFGGLFLWGYAQYVRPGPLEAPVTAVVPAGAGVEAIARTLADEGIVANPMIFRLGARLTRSDTALKAGEYLFPAGISPRETVALLIGGKTVVRRLTFAEGLTVTEILAQLAVTDGLTGAVATVPGEGSLLPETYHFSYGDSRADIIARMRNAMNRQLDILWADRVRGLPLKTLEEALILASIVERETGLPEERPLVARVFLNRLEKGMRLQSDPTVAYGVTGGKETLDRPLSLTDLKTPTPYNTYVIPGLPPAPICNPGTASLAATLRPAATDALYFVADGTGGHVFARTLAEHNRNVARWRRIERERRESGAVTP